MLDLVKGETERIGNHLIMFINRAMNPVNYARDPATFAWRRDELNVVLAFSGFYVRDDGKVVSWSIGTSSDAELVNTMLDAAIETVTEGDEKPIVHSDRGGHYRWPGRSDLVYVV